MTYAGVIWKWVLGRFLLAQYFVLSHGWVWAAVTAIIVLVAVLKAINFIFTNKGFHKWLGSAVGEMKKHKGKTALKIAVVLFVFFTPAGYTLTNPAISFVSSLANREVSVEDINFNSAGEWAAKTWATLRGGADEIGEELGTTSSQPQAPEVTAETLPAIPYRFEIRTDTSAGRTTTMTVAIYPDSSVAEVTGNAQGYLERKLEQLVATGKLWKVQNETQAIASKYLQAYTSRAYELDSVWRSEKLVADTRLTEVVGTADYFALVVELRGGQRELPEALPLDDASALPLRTARFAGAFAGINGAMLGAQARLEASATEDSADLRKVVTTGAADLAELQAQVKRQLEYADAAEATAAQKEGLASLLEEIEAFREEIAGAAPDAPSNTGWKISAGLGLLALVAAGGLWLWKRGLPHLTRRHRRQGHNRNSGRRQTPPSDEPPLHIGI